MAHLLRTLGAAAGVLLLSATLTGQNQRPPQPPARATEEEATQVTAIVVDVVVRDRQGKPVTGLTSADFEIQEDGVLQEIGSFTPVNRAGPPMLTRADAPAAPPAPAAPSAPAPVAPEVIALVFDRLSGEARALAHKAALNYIGDGKVATNVVSVFGVDLALTLYQPFTRDGDLLRKGIEAAGQQASSQYGNTREQQRAGAEMAARAAAATQGIGSGGPGQQAPNAGAIVEAQFAGMQARTLETFEALERDQQGYATSNSLMAIVSAMASLPGRKSVVFFSEGLSIPPNVQAQFLSVIAAANRANVSIYPMDAAGLRTVSPLKETTQGVNAGSQRNLGRNPTIDPTGRPMMMDLEDNEALLRADPHSGLGTLADQTGGFLIANTNDLRGGFATIETDMRNYYVLTYTPSNTRLDGRFRSIDVKVRQPDVRVRARKGYYAVRAPVGAPVLGYEAPALAVLEQTPVPNAFPARALALRFPEAARPGLVPVLVNVPTAGVTFRPADEKTYSSDFLVLVRFRDEAGQTIEKMSQRYQLQGPIAEMSRASQGEVLFYREPVLGSGVYSMEAVVYDALSRKATVRVATVEIPAVDPAALRLSSVMAIKRSEKVPESERVPGSPLYVGDQLLYPNMGEPLSKASAKELGFYFVVYPSANGGDVSATLELRGNGQQLARAPLTLAKPDATGRITQVSRIPVEALAPGTYELLVSVEQGLHRASRTLSFRVVS
jgi:VWFA-related protein